MPGLRIANQETKLVVDGSIEGNLDEVAPGALCVFMIAVEMEQLTVEWQELVELRGRCDAFNGPSVLFRGSIGEVIDMVLNPEESADDEKSDTVVRLG